jgi:hypothetical protein
VTNTLKSSAAVASNTNPGIKKKIPKWVAILYSEFTKIYKERWTDDFIDKSQMEQQQARWAKSEVLKNITPAELDACLIYCGDNLPWPPKQSEFVNILKKIRCEAAAKAEVERLKHSLPPPLTDVQMELENDIQAVKKLKDENPNLNWVQILSLKGQINHYSKAK